MLVPQLRLGGAFDHWYSYSTYDQGQVRISSLDPALGTWGPWTQAGPSYVSTSGGWTPTTVDLSVWAGMTVKVGFYHRKRALELDHERGERERWLVR